MKKNFLVVLLLSSIFTISLYAQSQSVESEIISSFNRVNTYLKTYKFMSAHAQSHHDSYQYFVTKSVSISYRHPNIIVTFVDGYTNSWAWLSSAIKGNKTLKMKLASTNFEIGQSYKPSVAITNNEGIEKSEGGEKELIDYYAFFGTSLNVKELCSLLNQFKRNVILNGFTGSLGSHNSANYSQPSSKRSISKRGGSKGANNKSKKSKSGRYGE